MVSITGSVRAGMQVAESAAHDLKRVHLESGGKAPVVVFDDADLGPRPRGSPSPGTSTPARTARRPPGCWPDRGSTTTSSPPSPSRRRPRPSAGPTWRTPTSVRSTAPPSSSALGGSSSACRPRRGGTGGSRVGDRGYCFAPTVVAGLHQDDEVIQEELFGPAITVQRFSDEDEAVAWANGVSTASPRACGPRTTAGPCGWPRRSTSAASGSTPTSRSSPRCPTGASSTRATARTCPSYGFEDYTRIKHVMSYIGS